MSWENKTISFVRQTSDWDKTKDQSDFLSYTISLLKIFADADVALKLTIEDKYTARVTDATPAFLNDLIIDPAKIADLYADGIIILYWKDVFKQHNVFDEIMQALSSAVILPIESNNKYDVIILGWSTPQVFTKQLEEFFEVVKLRIDEIAQQSYLLSTINQANKRFTSILQHIPQAAILIADDASYSWLNEKAANLLRLSEAGNVPSFRISPAMGKLMTGAVNKEDMNAAAMKIFSDPAAVLTDFKLKIADDNVLNVSCMPINDNGVKGRLWLFQQL